MYNNLQLSVKVGAQENCETMTWWTFNLKLSYDLDSSDTATGTTPKDGSMIMIMIALDNQITFDNLSDPSPFIFVAD